MAEKIVYYAFHFIWIEILWGRIQLWQRMGENFFIGTTASGRSYYQNVRVSLVILGSCLFTSLQPHLLRWEQAYALHHEPAFVLGTDLRRIYPGKSVADHAGSYQKQRTTCSSAL